MPKDKSGIGRRLGTFVSLLSQNKLDGAVVSQPKHVYYLTGYMPARKHLVFLVVTPDQTSLVVPEDQMAVAERSCAQDSVVPYEAGSIYTMTPAEQNAIKTLLKVLGQASLNRAAVGTELHSLSAFLKDAIAEHCLVSDVGSCFEQMRLCKDKEEIDLIRKAVAANDVGFETARKMIKADATEMGVCHAIHEAMVGFAGGPLMFDGDFVSGSRTEERGGDPTTRRLRLGDLFIIDLFPNVKGYNADSARTFVVGKPSRRQAHIHGVLETALSKGEAAIRPGLRACDLDAVVRGHIADAGYGECFPHHSGHGIGLTGYEAPYIVPADRSLLRQGMVLTLEPGIYIPGFGGMRLEQAYLVTAEGSELLSKCVPRLIPCI